MSLYKTFGTNAELEKTGVWLEYPGDTPETPATRIRIARAGGANVRYEQRLAALVKPHRRVIQNELADKNLVDKLMRQVYAETVVLGWENVTDAEGREMPFTVENAVKLFTELPELFADVQEQAQRVALFRDTVRELEAGN